LFAVLPIGVVALPDVVDLMEALRIQGQISSEGPAEILENCKD
jgi:hypothetical protein